MFKIVLKEYRDGMKLYLLESQRNNWTTEEQNMEDESLHIRM